MRKRIPFYEKIAIAFLEGLCNKTGKMLKTEYLEKAKEIGKKATSFDHMTQEIYQMVQN